VVKNESMDLIICIGILLVILSVVYIRKAIGWIKFKNKYPILSEELPDRILSVGDKVYIGKTELEYRGISTYNDLYYVFMSDNSLDPTLYREREIKEKIDSIYGSYGLKWKRVKSS
jgi:hypothetical protein